MRLQRLIPLVSCLACFAPVAWCAGDPGPFAVTKLHLLTQTQVSRTIYQFTYSADVMNQGTTLADNLTGTVASTNPGILNVTSNSLTWGPVSGGQTVTSSNSFTFTFDRSQTFSMSLLSFQFSASAAQAPTANAGMNQQVLLGSTVTLSGAGSTDPQGLVLTYAWTLESEPEGCSVYLTNATAVNPTLPVTCSGDYIVQLVVTNSAGIQSMPALVQISTVLAVPIANAGPNQLIDLTKYPQTVTLDGSASISPGGLPLQYFWFLDRPAGSFSALSNYMAVMPTFVPDMVGLYTANLYVDNGVNESAFAFVAITTENVAPVANAGANQSSAVGTRVELNGGGSTDANSLPLTYHWSILSAPIGSHASLSSTTVVNPSFTLDFEGDYIIQLIACNPYQCSAPATTTASTALVNPVANAGPNQTVTVGASVTLNGSASADSNHLTFTYSWSFNSKPTGSAALLANATSVSPTFTADKEGTYVVQLTVRDSANLFSTATVTISTNCLAPVANAGLPQNVVIGNLVTLSGAASSSPCGNSLTYHWTFNSVPPGSTAALTNPTTASPSFSPEVAGMYVVQLIVNDGTLNSLPVTVEIFAASAVAAKSITVELPTSVETYASVTGTVLLGSPAPAGGLTVSLTSSGAGVVTFPASVIVPATNTGVNFTISAGTTAGSAALTGSASGYTSGVGDFAVANRKLSVSTGALLGTGHMNAGTLTLAEPAPTGGITVTLTSGNTAALTVSPASVNLVAGANSAIFSVTGHASGTASLSASAPGYQTASQSVESTNSAVVLPANFTVTDGATLTYPVTLSTAAPAGGVTVTLTSSNATIAKVSPATVIIAAGATAPATNPTLTGAGIGPASIGASAPGYAPDNEEVSVQIPLTFSPTSLQIPQTNTQTVSLALASAAPAAGVVVNLSSSNSNVATVPATVTFTSGQTQASVVVTAGATTGSATITASGSGVAKATLLVTATIAPPITITCADALLGFNLQAKCDFSVPSQSSSLILATATSSDATKLLISGGMSIGSKSMAVNLLGASGEFFIQGLASSGSPTVTVSAPGYLTATVLITLAPSGFFFWDQVPNSVTLPLQTGAKSYIVEASVLGLNSLQLTNETVRPGLLQAVTFSISNRAVATAAAVSYDNMGTAKVNVTPLSAGTTTITVNQPPGYSSSPAPPQTYTTLSVTVTNSTISTQCTSLVIGYNLENQCTLAIPTGGTAPSFATVTSNNPNLLVSTSATAAGATSVNTFFTSGRASIYVQNISSITGSASFTVAATGYSTSTVNLTFGPATVNFTGNSMCVSGCAVKASTLTGPIAIPVYLNGTLRAGLTLPVTVTSSAPAIGTVPATVTFHGGDSQEALTFTPVTPGVTTLAITPPANFGSAANESEPVTVTGLTMSRSCTNLFLGYNLQAPCSLILAQPAPAGGLTVKLAVLAPTLALASSPTAAGTASLTLTYPAGSTMQTFYIQNIRGSVGEPGFQASAPAYSDFYTYATLVPSGFSFVLNTANTGIAAGPKSYSIYSTSIQNGAYSATQMLRGGLSLSLSLNDSKPAVGTVTTPVTFIGGNSAASTTFTPLSAGTTTLSITQPVGYTAASDFTELAVTVSNP